VVRRSAAKLKPAFETAGKWGAYNERVTFSLINRILRRFALPLAVLALLACAKHASTAEQLAPDALYDRALAALHGRDWTDAVELFERFVIQYPTHPRTQEARFWLGEAYFGKKEYITAATEFSRLANEYPAGPFADDARFKVCESYHHLSPRPQLDQQYTRAAVDHCQSLLTYYPTSDFAPRATEMVAELRGKLAQKDVLTGEFYMKRNAYDSAIIYFESAVQNYPDTDIAPRALMRLYETYQLLGYKEEADTAKQRLLKDYPTSAEAKQLQAPTAQTGSWGSAFWEVRSIRRTSAIWSPPRMPVPR
jgi:outer membrane protein assembly factor BamD